MALSEGTRLGPYEIIGLLGAGGMGEVYRARDPRLGRTVAIKILPSEFSSDASRAWRFEREARAVASLNHPHICTVHDIGEHEGHRYLVMEMMEGQPLDHRLAAGPLPLTQLLDLALQIADALESAHHAGVIHRDLKPPNIFVTRRGEAKLLDFGLAKLTDSNDPVGQDTSAGDVSHSPTTVSPEKTTLGSVLGTAAYMSPEQARGEPVTPASDLFAFGAVIYEMATGKRAFSGATTALLFDAILNRQPPPITSVNPAMPAELARIVEKALEKDPELRYQSAADMRTDLKRVRRDSQVRSGISTDPMSVVGLPPATPTPVPPAIPSSVKPVPSASESRLSGRPRSRRRFVVFVLILGVVLWRTVFNRSNNDDRQRRRRTASIEELQVTALTSSGNAFRPAVSRDGKYVVFLQNEPDGRTGLWLRQLGVANSVRIMEAEPRQLIQSATIGPDATFVDVLRSGALWRIPILGGDAKQIVERLNTPVAWSPDGKRMTYIRPSVTGTGQDLVIADSNGVQTKAVAVGVVFATGMPGGTFIAPAWSPDGDYIAMFQRLGEDVRDLGIRAYEVDDDESVLVKTPGDVPQGLAWLDRRTLLVSQALETGTASQLWKVSFPRGERTKFSADVGRYSELTITGDGDKLVTARPETRVDVWVGDAEARLIQQLPSMPFQSSAAGYAVVGWDEERLLLTNTANGRYEISRIELPNGYPETVAAGREFSVLSNGSIVYRAVGDSDGLWRVNRNGQGAVEIAKGSVSYPMVSPDDREVLYSARPDNAQTLWHVPIAGGEPRQVMPQPMGIASFSDISRDGRIIVDIDRQWTVCEFPTCQKREIIAPVQGSRPRWMPDGKAFTWVDPGSTNNLWLQPLDRSQPRRFTAFNDGKAIGYYAWSRNGKRLAISRATFSSDIVLFQGLKSTND